jgi:DNA primase
MRDQVLALVQRHMNGPFKPAGGSNVLCRCPFHKGGEERKPSFSVNLERALFHCFTCHVAGDLKYLLRLLGLPRSMIDAEVRGIQPLLEKQRELHEFEKRHTFSIKDPFKADYVLPEALLGVFEWCPSHLLEKGFSMEVLRDLEVGFDKLNGRVTYPLRDLYGNLAGFSGGVTPWTLNQSWLKYKVYQGGRKGTDGTWVVGDFGDWFDKEHPAYVCQNHDFLWNYHRVYPRALSASEPDSTIYVVEGFKACMWMIQNGYYNTVALMGSYISERQQLMLHRLGCTVVLFLDNDNAGRRASYNVGRLLWRPMYGKVRVVTYPVGEEYEDYQPDDFEKPNLDEVVSKSLPYMEYEKHYLKYNQKRS